MTKVFASCAVATVVLLLSSCGDGSNSKLASQAFSSKTYSTLDRTKEIRIISSTEIELSDGNLVGSYTREGNKIRAVFEALGTKTSRYFIETEEGQLTAEESQEKYFTEEARKKMDSIGVFDHRVKTFDKDKAKKSMGDGEDREAAGKQFSEMPKEMFLDLANGVNLSLARIRQGTFEMGDVRTSIHAVTISQPFYIGKYEVTQEQYEAVMDRNPSLFKGAKNPVECVSWDDAQDFCQKLSVKTGKIVRLPTEAEWEYACRAGTTTAFYSGDANADLDNAGWYDGNSSRTTHPVGEKAANAFGLYDMHGNVAEWCQDWFDRYDTVAQIDPVGPAASSFMAARVVRGGSYSNVATQCSSAMRFSSPPKSGNFAGFRVVVSESLSKAP